MSKRISRNGWTIATVTLVLALVGGSALYAQDPKAKGSVSGVILTADGKPAVGLAVRLERTDPADMGGGAGRKGRNRSAGIDSGAVDLQSRGEKGIKIVGRATTDQQGKFHIQNIDPGAAILVGGSKSMGWIYYPVEIQPGQETKLGEIKLAKE